MITHTSHVLIFQEDAVLLVKHGEKAGHITGIYGIPGGHLHEHESMKQAAVREFYEETGLEITEEELQTFPRNEYTAEILRKDGKKHNYTMHIFLAHIFEGQLKSSGETIPEWVRVDKLDTLSMLPNVKEAIQAAKEYLEEGFADEG